MKIRKQEEAELIDSLKKNENWAFQRIYKLYYHMVERHVLSNSGSSEDCKDLFQDTVISLIKSIDKPDFVLNANTRLSTFIFSIAKNQWLMKLKVKKKASKIVAIASQNELKSTEDNSTDATELIMKSLERIGEDCKELLKQYYFNKVQLKVIGEAMGYTESFVRVKKNRCMNALRKDVFLIGQNL